MNRLSSHTCLLVLGLLAPFLLWHGQAEAARGSPKLKASRVFLQKQLPLTLIVTTPTGLAGNGPVTSLLGRQALTAVFSRPVIALGSDFGQPSAQLKFPFSLSGCGVPGKSRWVTTSIARFDPDVDWPTDLDCELVWNTNMTTYDGAPLVLGATSPRRRLTTSPLSMYVTDVTSALATNLTDGMWTAFLDGQYEVPPDGKILLSFGHPVNLQLLKSAVKVVESAQPSGPGVAFDVGPCQSAAPWFWYPMGRGGAAASSSSSDSGVSLNVNTSCAEIGPKSQLKPGTPYLVVLTRGSRYHALAGPLQRDLSVTVNGLRPFRLPFANTYSNNPEYGTRFRRLDLWLPHGLSSDTPPEALASRISLCRLAGRDSCSATPFSLALTSRGKARLNVSTLQPRSQYRISVAADARVKDGFGQGLQASELTFYTSPVSYGFGPPSVDSSVAVLEAGADSLAEWPFVTRGLGPSPYYGEVAGSIRAWELDLTDDKVKASVVKSLPQYSYTVIDPASWLGKPTATLPVPSELLSTAADAPDWRQLLLPLRDRPSTPSRARLVAVTSTKGYNLYAKLLLNSTLSFNVLHSGQRLTAWLLDGAPGGGPVAGATVTVLKEPLGYWNQEEPQLLAKCVTDSDGLCTMTYTGGDGWSLTAFAVAGGQFAVLEGAGFAREPAQPPSFVGSLVADRLVVVPGDSVKVTGFVQRVTINGLQLPDATYGALRVSPHWQASAAASTGAAAGGVAVRPGGGRHLHQLPDASDGANAVLAVKLAAEVLTLPMEGSSDHILYGGNTMAQEGFSSSLTSEAAPAAFPVQISGMTGTFHAEIPIPQDVRLQSYTLQLAVPPPGTDPAADPSAPKPKPGSAELLNWAAVPAASLTITVADPRPPTADLKLVAPPWTFPNSSVAFNVTAVSYIGASVGGAAITVTWRTAKASGALSGDASLITDADGVAAGTIELGSLPPANVSDPYDTLHIDVEWIGPTRERITRSAKITLADGPARLEMKLSLSPSTPGTAFAVSATLTSNTDGAPLTGLPVTATLRPDPNDTTATTPASSLACATASSSCVLTSGAPFSSACQLTLPCVGRFLLEACADVPGASLAGAGAGVGANKRVCSRQTLGRNASEWAAKPLTGHTEPQLFTDKSSYKVGDVVKLQLQNPWPGARLLLHWGNEYRSRYQVIASLAAGLADVSVGPLGDEALGGASLIAVLDVPRLDASALPSSPSGSGGVSVPTSPLFDPLAPHSHVLRAALDVRPDNALGVSVGGAASGAEGDGDDDDAGWTIRDVEGAEVVAVEPGATAEVTVTVRNGLGADAPAPAAGSVEVTVYGVDKAFLDLLPYDLPHPEQEMVLRLAANVNAYGMAAYRLAPGAVRAVYDKLMARLTGQDPWLPLDTGVRPNAQRAAVDANDTAYAGRYATPLTTMPAQYWYSPGYWEQSSDLPAAALERDGDVVMEAAMGVGSAGGAKGEVSMAASNAAADGAAAASYPAPAAAAAAAPAPAPANSAVSVRYESDFVVTPLFATATADANGRARVTFTAPQNLGTFVLRAFAASGSSGRYGSGESKLAVRRRLSLTPSLPRFVRVGDTFAAGVLLTVGSAPATVTVTLELGSAPSAAAPLSLTAASTQKVTFAAGDVLQKEVRFSFSAGAIGSSNLTFTARDSQPGGGADALQAEIPVTGQQGDVWVATSFALTALNPSRDAPSVVQWQEGMELPAAVPGSGGLNLTAGVGYFPAIAATYDSLLQAESDRSYASAVPAVMWATLPAVLSYYGQPISEAQGEAVARGFKELAKLTRSDVGLLWSDPDRWYGWKPTTTDLYLNTWALVLSSLHGPALRSASQLPASLAPLSSSWTSLESGQVPQWRAAVARQLVEDAVQARQSPYYPGPYSDWYTLAWARLALGGGWVPFGASDQIRGDLSLATLISNNQSMGRQARVVTALVLQAMGSSNPAPGLVAGTVEELTSALRVQGRTAYVAAAPGASAAASLEEQALALLLLLRAGITHQLLPKLAAYVANPQPTGGYGIYYFGCSGRDQGLTVAALSEYDRVRGSSKPNVDLTADVNGLTVLKASFKAGGSTRPVSNATAWEDIPPPPQDTLSELNFEVTGSGEVTVAASLHFVPSTLLPFPSYRGLFVEAALQMADPRTGGPTGRRLASVPLGSVVALTLQLTSPDDLGPVTLSVMMPGGLEPIDPNLEAAAGGGARGLGLSCGANWVDSWSSVSRWWWWWPMCPSQETRPSVVTFSYLALRSGTSSVTLRAVAATPGTFVFPPVRASADNQPELMGMTAAGSITVCADCKEPTFAGPPPVPIACQNDCSGNGMCNLRTGRCRCDCGFGRADCSRPVPY